MIKVESIVTVRTGLYLITYTHECDCGCTKTRHNLTVASKNKPTDNKAKQLANDDYDKR